MSKKILIIGASGMLGHMAYHYLAQTKKYDIYNTVFRSNLTNDSIKCDVRNKEQIRGIIEKIRPDFILNCVGALIGESKKNTENTILLNSVLPHYLKKMAEEVNGRLIHISTDCVFSGSRGGYKDNDFRDADDIYGRSKALGEIFSDAHVTIRTSIIGPEFKKEGEGLFHWLMNQRGVINGYTNAIWSGLTTLQLAKIIEAIIEKNLTGLIQVSSGEEISKYQLLSLLIEQLKLDHLTLKKCANHKINKSLLPSEKYNFRIPSYENMIIELMGYINSNKYLYPHYFEK